MKKVLITLFILLTTICFCSAQDVFVSTQRGLVKNLQYEDITLENDTYTRQLAEVLLLSGEEKGQIKVLQNVLTGNPHYDIPLKQGIKVLLHVEDSGEGTEYSISDVERAPILGWLAIIFCFLLIYVGKHKGLYSLVSIVLTCLLIFKFLSPLILFGVNPIFATILISLFSTAVTMYLVGGVNRKSTSATLGCVLSLIFAGLLAYFTVKIAYLTGFTNEHSLYLYSAHPQLNFVSIAVSTMILATLGAVMDVAMSIASTINEIYTLDDSKTVKELFVSGMNVGKDIIGTMANTLILVYLGGSLPLLLLASNIDLQKFINLNQVVTEISSALIGSCAIVICVPITAIVTSSLLKKTTLNFDILKGEE